MLTNVCIVLVALQVVAMAISTQGCRASRALSADSQRKQSTYVSVLHYDNKWCGDRGPARVLTNETHRTNRCVNDYGTNTSKVFSCFHPRDAVCAKYVNYNTSGSCARASAAYPVTVPCDACCSSDIFPGWYETVSGCADPSTARYKTFCRDSLCLDCKKAFPSKLAQCIDVGPYTFAAVAFELCDSIITFTSFNGVDCNAAQLQDSRVVQGGMCISGWRQYCY
jgi:hypothetical protein